MAFVATGGMIIPKHLYEPYKGANSREAPANLKPVGNARFVDFKPGDLVKGERNPSYHVPNRPHFDTIEIKGGGDAVSAARAVIQTGEYDLHGICRSRTRSSLDWKVAAMPKAASKSCRAGVNEHIQINSADPWTEVDGERSSAKTKHPLLTDPAVRRALTPSRRPRLGGGAYLRAHRGSDRKFPQRP